MEETDRSYEVIHRGDMINNVVQEVAGKTYKRVSGHTTSHKGLSGHKRHTKGCCHTKGY